MAEKMLRIAIAGEDSAHYLLASRLAEAVLVRLGVDPLCVKWVGDGEGGTFLSTTPLNVRAKAASGRPRYRSQRVEGLPKGFGSVVDAIVERLAGCADLVLYLYDEDGDPDRLHSVSRACRGRLTPAVVAGGCVPMSEAWLVALIGPQRPRRLALVERELQRRVAAQPESMCSKPASAPHHAKRVLNFLLDEGIDSVSSVGAKTPSFPETEGFLHNLDLTSIERLKGCGLADFVRDLEDAMKRPLHQVSGAQGAAG